ncbi:MAG: hypothetical protein Q9187_006987 [Circinaria calcarea]
MTPFLFNLEARVVTYEAALRTQASLLHQSAGTISMANATLNEQAKVIQSVAESLEMNSSGQPSANAVQILTAAAQMKAEAEKGAAVAATLGEGQKAVQEGLKMAGVDLDL